MASKSRNPLAFTPWPVTIITTAVYLALIIPLLVIHLNVPTAPRASPSDGWNLTEAWHDLQALTRGFHPYNSRENDHVHAWLLERIDEIVNAAPSDEAYQPADKKPEVIVFDDLTSNLTFFDRKSGVYFEGTNILVYIRGSEDQKDKWWETPAKLPSGKGGVLVNAHYDSVSTGYGATDDGVGVITGLQLVKYFLTPGHAPRRGLVVLFNNGEEDYLNGARAFSQHPMSKFVHTFLNLEGAGAGGRATLFRSTDTEVTHAYARSQHPFGSIVSANGFELVGSQTDYVVFDGDLGLRGLDVAFYEPRARYHTEQDDARHTSVDSLWHMLSAAVATTEGLVFDDSDQFDGPARVEGNVPNGQGTKAVWFDLFGSAFAVFRLHTLFALSVTLLIVAPLALIVTSIGLSHADKMYLFRSNTRAEFSDEKIPLQGLRGFFRFPFLLGVPTAVCIGFAFLLAKVNPMILHSGNWAVWSMMISGWVFMAWFVSCVADFARPSAFHRVYSFTWMFVISWVLLVLATVLENDQGLGGGYFTLFYFASIFLATWISYLELFFLPRKSEYVSKMTRDSRQPSSHGSRLGTGHSNDVDDDNEEAVQEEATESTSLLRGQQRTTFANYVSMPGNHSDDPEDDTEPDDPNVYGNEQAWSASLPSWTWLPQLLLTIPINVVILVPLALITTSALNQIGQDGDPTLVVYLLMAFFITMIFMPVLPYIHRYTYHIPVFLFLVLIGTLIYNLVAFPFSHTNRVKLYFSQQVDLDRGNSSAYLAGVSPFVEDVVRGLPSAGGHTECHRIFRHGQLLQCSWPGVEPHVVPSLNASSPSPGPSADWVSSKITPSESSSPSARFELSGLNTRACRITMQHPSIKTFSVAGSSVQDKRFIKPASEGMSEIRLWSRTWDGSWTVDVDFKEHAESLRGLVSCLWSDDNNPELIPALTEARKYVPAWVALTKLADGLVEGYREFEIVKDESGRWVQKQKG
ncbi:Vacuolar membrane protease [Penicillium diatomitis]|uniref:Peptide hydrolase n=1 Tax=Penicillium diatomitis TaxID=2819901 RepID=A0A9W9WUQ9_9EURO|nr:Vacuolar membrane protease [Penicillium diatomitis]KAJ5477058.1 Vacuolar membrane protease [Penicillium diatomitis]